ncbi:MAG: MMPL family transporter [Pseudomonadota bacterium]
MASNQHDPIRHRPSVVTRQVARARYLVFVALLGVSIVLGWHARSLQFDFSVDAVYVSEDPELRFYREIVAPAFGSGDNMLAVLVVGAPLLSSAALADLGRVHETIAALPGVTEVRSLVNARVPVEDGDVFSLLPLFANGRAPVDDAGIALLRQRMQRAPSLKGRLLSSDLTTAAVVAFLDGSMKSQHQRGALVRLAEKALAPVIAAASPGVQIRLSGIPVFSENLTELLKRDQMTFVPGVLLVMGILLWLAFRSLRGVLLPFVATGTATLWTLGVMSIEGHSINVANNAIVVLLLVIGVSDAIHLLSRFEEELRLQRAAGITPGKLKTVAVVTEHLGLACLLTSMTTAVGFGSLIVARLPIIQEFGADAAIGVMLAWLVTIGLVPALLAILPLPGPRRAMPTELSDRFLGALARFALRRRHLVVIAALLVTALSIFGASRLRAHDRILAELPAGHPSLETLRLATDKLGGFIPFDIVLETPPGRADDPDVLAGLDDLQRYIESQPRAPSALSVMDLLDGVDRAVRGDAREPLAWTPERVAQYLLLVELAPDGERELRPYLSSRRDLARIACFADDVGTGVVLAWHDALLKRGAEVLPADVVVHVTGPLVVTSSALTLVVNDMFSSLALALVVILVVMGLLFRSARIGVLALVPNAVPVLMALGVMGLSGISLRPATAVIFSMALGIAVDNSIHFLSRYREERAQREDVAAAIEAAVRGTGRPILYTTVMLSAGLGVLLLSDFVALQHLAILGSTTFASAMVVDLLLLPVLLWWLKPR